MTSPDRFVPTPPDTGPPTSRLAEIIGRGITSPTGPVVGEAIRRVAEAIVGRPLTPEEAIGAVEDMQAALAGRVDLLDGTRGYACAYQAVNINLAFGGTANVRDLPFTEPLGPTRGAEVIRTGAGGIRFHEAGLWTIFALVHGRKTRFTNGFLESDGIRAWIRVHTPDGQIYSEAIGDHQAGPHEGSVAVTLPVVIPGPDYYVTVTAWSGRWRWFDGGTRYTRLAVLKNDSRPVDPGTAVVPDEQEH